MPHIPVSIVLPCYNASEYLRDALDSLVHQSYKTFEVIAIDDGSSDNTWEVIRNYADNDPRIKAVRHEVNKGLIYTLNSAIEMCSGELVVRMDADDISYPGRLELLVNFMFNHPACVAASTAMEYFTDSSKRVQEVMADSTSKSLLFLSVIKTPLNHPASVFRTETIRRYMYGDGPECTFVEDYDLWCRMLGSSEDVRRIPMHPYQYRVSAGVSAKNSIEQRANFLTIAKGQFARVFGREIRPGTLAVLVNKFDRLDEPHRLRSALKELKSMRQQFVSMYGCNEIDARCIATESRFASLDILIQASKKGSASVRVLSFLLLIFELRNIWNATYRAYCRMKIQYLLMRPK